MQSGCSRTGELVSAEESAAQVRLRAQRLSNAAALRIPVIAETDEEALIRMLLEAEVRTPTAEEADSVQVPRRASRDGRDLPNLRLPGTQGRASIRISEGAVRLL